MVELTWQERMTYDSPCNECDRKENPHHKLDEAYKEIGIEAIVAVEREIKQECQPKRMPVDSEEAE